MYATFIETVPNLDFDEGLSNDPNTKNLVVIDDVMAETDGSVTILFIKNNHHANTSLLYFVQSQKNKESRIISLIAQYVVLFKYPRNCQIDVSRSREIHARVKDATSVPHCKLLIDLKHGKTSSRNTPFSTSTRRGHKRTDEALESAFTICRSA